MSDRQVNAQYDPNRQNIPAVSSIQYKVSVQNGSTVQQKQNMQIKSEAIDFDGPLELLLTLISKSEIDIYDIPISELTDQYIEYINSFNLNEANFMEMSGDDAAAPLMDNMSGFILMAATLLEIKSKMLIPKPQEKREDEDDPRDELVKRLVEYKRFKDITEDLKQKELEGSKRYFKPEDPGIKEFVKNNADNRDVRELIGDLTLNRLYDVFSDVMNRRENRRNSELDIKPIDGEKYTVENKIEHINGLLRRKRRLLFTDVFSGCSSKIEKVVTFLAVLELIRQLKIKVAQEEVFDEIYIYKVK